MADDVSTHWEETEGQTAKDASAATDQHFWADADGAHVSSTGDHDLSGANLLLTAAKLAFRNALTELFSIVVSGTSAVVSFLSGKLTISHGLWDSGPLDTSVIDASDNNLKITSDVGVMSGSFYDRSTFRGSYTSCTPHQYALVGDTFKISNNAGSGSSDLVSLVVDPKRLADAIQPVVLYNGGANLDYDVAPGAGTAGTVTLSETAAHFRELTVFGKYQGYETSVTLTNPNGLYTALQLFIPDAGPATLTYVKSRAIAISGTSITSTAWTAMWLSASTNHFDAVAAPEIAIVRVTGRR